MQCALYSCLWLPQPSLYDFESLSLVVILKSYYVLFQGRDLKLSLDPATQNTPQGQKVAVDAYCWLHRGTYSCALELVQGMKTDKVAPGDRPHPPH